MYVLSRMQNSQVRYSLLYIHHFRLCAPKRILESQQLHRKYRQYEEVDNVPDRLRWCRHCKGLTQAEAAQLLDVSKSTYLAFESGTAQSIPLPVVEKLSDCYGMPMTDFMDEFTHFLQDGQAERIRSYRERLGLGKKPFARAMGIPIRSLQAWESGSKQISRKSWETYFKGLPSK